jgi:hypothetical protein
MDWRPHKIQRSPTTQKRYDYEHYSYTLTQQSYDNLKKLANEAQYTHSYKVLRGISDYINNVRLAPNLTPDDVADFEAMQDYAIKNGTPFRNMLWLSGSIRVARKLAISPDQRKYLANLGLTYGLWQKQRTETALVSGILEAWGNGMFTATLRPDHYRHITRRLSYQTLELTAKQSTWLYRMSQMYMYERSPWHDKQGRGYIEFIKDFRYVKFEPYPFDPQIENPHGNVPPSADNYELHTFNFKTSPNLQLIFTRELWCPLLPDWYDELPYERDYTKFEPEAAIL